MIWDVYEMSHTCSLITKESELHHSIGSPIDGAHPGPKTDRDYLGGKGEKERWLSVGVVA